MKNILKKKCMKINHKKSYQGKCAMEKEVSHGPVHEPQWRETCNKLKW